MDPKRLFKDLPPREPLTSIGALVRDFKYRYGPGKVGHDYVDHVVFYCGKSKSLSEAVKRACASRDANGKMHNHQSRVREVDRQRFANEIVARGPLIQKAKGFDELFDIIEGVAPPGIGPVTVYDVATRINGYLLLPQSSLYLHAGVRIGWKLLYGNRSPNEKRVPMPKELKGLSADDAESFLCAYRGLLKPGLLK